MPAKPVPVIDPYVTLGLEPGAPMAEVKRAYRRLAKVFHPDSAGEQAVPRFLAIQAAYEQIRTGRVALGGTRGARTAEAPAAPTSEPWRADPARARAARERARTGPSSTTGTAGSGRPSGAGTGPGDATGGRRSTGTSGSAGSGAGRRRATRKATMGSTSYDEARDPADATWSGASWYGPSTGEYWIVNPREYADPRKHGPDYQQRARRPLQGSAPDEAPDHAAAPGPEAAFSSGAAPAPDPAAAASTTHGPSASSGPSRADTAPERHEAPRAQRTRETRWSSTATESGWSEPRAAPRRTPEATAPDLEERAASRLRWLGEPADDPVRRLGQALVAWPPIGLVVAALIGAATGCAAFGAACDGAEPMLPWLAQPVILGLLLLVPPLTRVLAVGTIAILVGVVPITSLLLAVGAAGASEAGPALSILLVVLWMVGVAWAAAVRLRRLGGST